MISSWFRDYLAAGIFLSIWVCWCLLALIVPVSPNFQGTYYSTTLFIISQVAMFGGLVAAKPDIASHGFSPRRNVSPSLMGVLFVLSFVSIYYRLLDYVVVRQVNMFSGSLAVREVLEKTGPNLFSAISAITSPAVFACAGFSIIQLLRGEQKFSAAIGVALLPLSAVYSLSFGGRFPALVGFIFILVFTLLLRRPTKRMVVVTALLATIFFFASMFVFLNRINEFKMDLSAYSTISSVSQIVPPKPIVVAAIRDAPPFIGGTIFYLLSLCQYAIHGVFEFFLLANSLADQGLAWGRYQFFPLDRALVLLSKLGLIAAPLDVNALNPRPGFYSTFWGPAYIDFGMFMPIYGFILGAMIRFVERHAQSGDVLALPLYALFLVQVLLSPITNGLTASGLLYVNMGLAALWFAGFARNRSIFFKRGMCIWPSIVSFYKRARG